MNEKQFSYFLENDWEVQGNEKQVSKTFEFKNFKRAFSWMTSLAFEAENQNHHPEWKNIYNKVEVTLTTHDIGMLSEKDVSLAKAKGTWKEIEVIRMEASLCYSQVSMITTKALDLQYFNQVLYLWPRLLEQLKKLNDA